MRKNVEKIPGVGYFDVNELAESYPDILNLEGFVGDIVDIETGYAKPRSYLRAIKECTERKGTEFEPGTEVTGIETETDNVTNVTIAPDDLVQCDSIVVVAGMRTESLVAEFTDLPVQPLVICVAAVRGDPVFNGSVPTTSGRGTLIRPNIDDDLLVGDEYWIEDLGGIPWNLPKEAQGKVAELLPQLSIGFDGGLEYVGGDGYHCPEGTTIIPDQVPIINEIGNVDGLAVTDGSRGAVPLAPIVAVAMQPTLTGTETEFSLDWFTIDRLDLEDPEYDLPVITESRS